MGGNGQRIGSSLAKIDQGRRWRASGTFLAATPDAFRSRNGVEMAVQRRCLTNRNSFYNLISEMEDVTYAHAQIGRNASANIQGEHTATNDSAI